VVAPKDLRDRLAGEARRLGELYGTNRPPTIELRHQRLLQCWGKTVDKSEEYHPAIFHMIDVANVALALLEGSSENRYRWILQRAFNTNVGELWKWIPWIVGLHDVGKISLPFQQCNPVQKQRLERNGFHMTGWAAKDRCPHSLVSEIFLTKLLHDNKQDAFNSRTVMLAEAVGGHHGSYLRQKQINLNEVKLEVSEHPEWQQLRLEAADILKELFLKIDPSSLPEPENVSVALAALTGFMILCDWIGSDSRFFSPVPEMSVEEYRQISRRRAQEAIEMFGVNEATVITQRQTFSELFVDISQPRPLQLAVDKIPQELLDTPSLVVLEAPTGEGKTEAALAIAHRIASARPHADFYYALPTTATSNQMFLRLQRYVREQLHLPSEVKLVHGQSFLIEEKLRIAPMRNEEGTENESSSLEWFMGKKRALLAPFGVGTVDQAELGALNVRHAVLRLFGLAGKVVIIDEIHAYDIYMTTIISQLLQWLAMMGTSVILLSATLPTERRRNLITAYCGSPGQIAETSVNEYPLLVVATQNAVYLDAPPAWQTDRTLNLAFLQFNVDDYRAQAGWLLDAVIDGGCACWITNIVGRSQKLFTEIQNLAAERLLDIDLLLLHSQFPLYKRQELEQEVVSRYGKDGNRPIRGIVIGTQVLEQSLDLDFDIMVSDLAPIDLMLQRAGRLHRHLRQRPPAHSEARLWVHDFNFTTTDALPRGDIHVYSEYILRLTHGCIRNRIQLSLPKDFRTLVEEVYSAEPPTESDPLFSAWKKLKQEQDAAAQCASERLLPRPNAETPFSISSTDLEFIDDENSSGWLVAMTRLGDVSINVIPLEVRTRMAILKSGDVVSLDRWADRTTALQILEHGLRVSNRDLIEALESVETVPLVRDTSLLRNHVFLKLEEGKAHLKSGKKSITCILDPHLGLVVTKD
jgi:CRISPR-associated endonuclease/helicase Cas3